MNHVTSFEFQFRPNSSILKPKLILFFLRMFRRADGREQDDSLFTYQWPLNNQEQVEEIVIL